MKWFSMLSEGSLTLPNLEFVNIIKELDAIFDNFNGGGFNLCMGYLNSLLQLSVDVEVDVRIKKLFFKCKTFFKIRIYNAAKKKRIHNDKLRKLST